MNTGLKIRNLREKKGFSQEYMALQLGISQRTYGRYENGESKIDVESVGKIAKVLEVDPYELIDFDRQSIFNNHDQKGGNATNIGHAININFNIFSEEVKKLYEKLIEEKDERIRWLEKKGQSN